MKLYSLKHIFSILLILIICKQAAGEPLLLDSTFTSIFFNKHIEFYEDIEGELSIESIINEPFHELKTPIINFNYSKSTYWFKGSIKNPNQIPFAIHVKNRNHFLELFELYVLANDTVIKKFQTGSLMVDRLKTMSFIIPPNSTYTVFFKVKSSSLIRVPIYAFSNNSFVSFSKKNHLFSGIVYGIYGFLILLTLIIIVSLKEKIYIYFAVCLIAVGVFFLGYDDLLPYKEILGKPNFWLITSVSFIAIFQVAYMYFSKLFFNYSQKQKRLNTAINTLLVISVIQAVIYIFNYTLGNKLSYYLSPFLAILLFAISLYNLIWLKMKYMRFYVLASFFMLVGIILHLGSNIGLIPNFNLSFYAFKTSYLVLLSVFAYALTDRFIIFSRSFTKILNEKVEERTTELEHTLRKLQSSQQQVIQSEKMASVGILTAGLAHELNNPLNYINGGIELIKSVEGNNIDSNQELKQAFRFIEDGYNRSANIVSSILEFSHSAEEIKTEISLEEIIERTITILKPNWEGKVQFNSDYQFNSKVPAFKSKIHQVFITLIDNAIHFSQIDQGNPEIYISTFKDESWVSIEIQNNGPHIPREDITKIFDPFYTTREVGTGPGLGLTNALALIHEHSGEILVRNNDAGVVFTIKLPFIDMS